MNEAERLSAVVLNSLDEEGGTPDDLARRAFRSRTQFYRLFQALIDENPGNHAAAALARKGRLAARPNKAFRH